MGTCQDAVAWRENVTAVEPYCPRKPYGITLACFPHPWACLELVLENVAIGTLLKGPLFRTPHGSPFISGSSEFPVSASCIPHWRGQGRRAALVLFKRAQPYTVGLSISALPVRHNTFSNTKTPMQRNLGSWSPKMRQPSSVYRRRYWKGS